MDHDEYLKEIETFARRGVQLSQELGIEYKAGEYVLYLLGRLEAAERTAKAAYLKGKYDAATESEAGIVD